MIDPMSLIIGGGLVAAGYGCGRIGRARRRPPPEPPKPICVCGHAVSHHHTDGACQHVDLLTDQREVPITDGKGKPLYDPDGYAETDHQVVVVARTPCTCQRYTGPQPLPEFFAPEIV